LNWRKMELEDLKTDIELGVEVTSDLIKKEKPDVVIIATGSESRIPDIPGIEKNKVTTDIDLFLGKKRVGKNVVIVGGGMIGCETALWLVQQGKNVTIVEQLSDLMIAGKSPVPHPNRIMLLDLLKLHKVEVLTNYFIAEITDEGVALVSHDFERRRVEADTVGISIGLRPNNELYRALVGKVSSLYLIGDAREVRNVMGSIWDAYEVARTV